MTTPGHDIPTAPPDSSVRFGSRLVYARQRRVAASPETTFAVLEHLGGPGGWFAYNFLWRLRGALDRLAGGVGMRRGRPARTDLVPGDTVDFWRVEHFERPKRIRLAAEMRLPGQAWLEFDVEPAAGGSLLRQAATFDPLGLAGLAYWYGIYPVHALVFRAMLAKVARAAETRARAQDTRPA